MAFVQVSPDQLQTWLDSLGGNAAAVLLDVREAWELATASAANSAALPANMVFKHIPMQSIPARLDELNPDVPLALLCHHGTRSLHVGHFLAQRGFAELANVHGGIDAWSQGADPLVARY